MVLPPPVTDPHLNHALIVAVEAYRGSSFGLHLDLDGPVRDALAWVDWLVDGCGVPPGNVYVLASPLPANKGPLDALARRGVACHDEPHWGIDTFKDALRTFQDKPGRLWLAWSGDGVIEPDGDRFALLASYRDDDHSALSIAQLLRRLRTAAFGFPSDQVLVFDTCADPLRRIRATPVARLRAIRRRAGRRGLPPVPDVCLGGPDAGAEPPGGRRPVHSGAAGCAGDRRCRRRSGLEGVEDTAGGSLSEPPTPEPGNAVAGLLRPARARRQQGRERRADPVGPAAGRSGDLLACRGGEPGTFAFPATAGDGMDFFRDLHVQVRVGPRRRNSLEDRDRERRRLTGMATFDDRFEGRQTSAYRPAADETRFPRGSSDPPLPWFDETTARTAREVHPWAVLLGDPGMGKTTLLRYEGWLVANEALSALEDGSARPEDLVIPIYARLADLADQADDDVPGLLARAGVDAGRGSGTPAGVLRDWVLEKLKDGRVIVLLDALDELSDQDHDLVMRRLVRWVGDHRPQGLYITSRPAGYRRIPPELRDGVKPELELVAFTPAEVRGYVVAYFGAKSPESAALWAQLQVSPGLLGLAQIPLMLTLICLVCRGGSRPIASPAGHAGRVARPLPRRPAGSLAIHPRRGYDPEMSPEEEVELRGKRNLWPRLPGTLRPGPGEYAVHRGGLRQGLRACRVAGPTPCDW